MKEATLFLGGETVLENVNLKIIPETTTVILGLSGSGKSTLLKVLAGLIQLSSGEILFDHSNIGKMGEKDFFKMQAQSGFVFQDSALWANRTIYENLSIPLRIMDPYMDLNDMDRRITAAVDIFNFRENLSVRPSAISAGEKKVISFLRALMTDPDILFLDEPTTSIDKRNISKINSVIMELKQKKKTIITVTHDFKLVRNIADNIILIDRGKIVKSGSFIEIDKSEDENISRIIEELKGQV